MAPVPTAGQGKRSAKPRRPRRTVSVTMTLCPGKKYLVRVQSSKGVKPFWYDASEPLVAVVADLLNRGL